MGEYIVDVRELVQAFHDALEDVEGDFDSETLSNALEITKDYPWVSDVKTQEQQEIWGDYLNGDDVFSGN